MKMKIKRIVCILLCVTCLLLATSCAKNTDTVSQPQINDALAMLYGFSKIEKVNYYCAKNTPKSDSIYVVSSVVTDTSEKSDIPLLITCKNKDVTINGNVITVPYKYTKWHKSLKLNALHESTGLSFDFKIEFEDDWNIVFEDNFDGTELNTDVWNVWDFTDWQYFYSPESVFLDGKGNLINRMQINETEHPEYGYTKQTGAITTLDKFENTYGYYEIRMIPNMTSGLWSAYWLVSGDMSDKDATNDGSAANGFEVDIVETYYYRDDPAQTIHWDGYHNDQTKTKSFSMAGMSQIFDGNYHTFAFRWTPDEYAFLIDGVVTNRTSEMGICNQPAYLLVSAHYGNAGDLLLKPGEYSDMIVDYVKVYQSPAD